METKVCEEFTITEKAYLFQGPSPSLRRQLDETVRNTVRRHEIETPMQRSSGMGSFVSIDS